MLTDAISNPAHLGIRPLGEKDRSRVADIYVAGFLEEEVRPIMPRHLDQAVDVFAELIQPDANSWVAERGGAGIVGLAICRTRAAKCSHMVNWNVLRRHLPLRAALRAWVVGRYMYEVDTADDELYLQSLVVEARWQGQGVGTSLVEFVCDEACRRGYRTMTVSVVGGNGRARSLYERLGFSTVDTTSTGLFQPLVGWSSLDHMKKIVRQEAHAW